MQYALKYLFYLNINLIIINNFFFWVLKWYLIIVVVIYRFILF